MAIIDYDVIIEGSSGAAMTAAAKVKQMGQSVACFTEDKFFGGMLTGGLGHVDYVGAGVNDTISGLAREFFVLVEQAAIADGATSDGYSYHPNGLIRYYAPEWGRAARDQQLAGIDKYADIEIADVHVDPATKKGGVVTFSDGRQIRGRQLLGGSYEAILGRKIRIPYSHGRAEAYNTYGETQAGSYLDPVVSSRRCVNARGDIWRGHQTPPHWKRAEADTAVQGFDFRLTLSSHPDRIPFPAPPNYRLEDFRDWIDKADVFGWTVADAISSGGNRPKPYLKTTNGGDQTGFIKNYLLADTKAKRRAIWNLMFYRHLGWFYTAQNSGLVNSDLQADVARWGLPHDHNMTEFFGTPGWSSHMYIREHSGMHAQYFMTFADMIASGARKFDVICRAGYNADSHDSNKSPTPDGRSLWDGRIHDDGRVYYDITFRAIKPPASVIVNMLEIGCPGFSRTVRTSARMEPTWMVIGEAAGAACCVANDNDLPVGLLPYNKLRPALEAYGARI